MPRIAFVSPIPEHDLVVRMDVLKVHTTVDPYTGSSVTYRDPIALEYIQAFTEDAGYETKLFTETFKHGDPFIKEILKWNPDVVAISVHSAVVRPDTVEIAREIKRNSPGTIVVIGGYHPTGEIIEYARGNLERTLLHSKDIDFVVYGEGEETFVKLIQSIFNGKKLDNVLGIAYKENGKIKINPRRQRINFSRAPWPKRTKDIIKASRCAPLAYPPPNKQKGAAQISASRGCVYGCDFCSSMTIWPKEVGKDFGRYPGEPIIQRRDVSDVVDEMKYLKDEFDVNFFTITDLTFNVSEHYAVNLCEKILSENVAKQPRGSYDDVGWFAYVTVDKTIKKPKVIEKMAEAGCTRIGVGIESLHKEILQEHKPNNTYETELKALRVINEAGPLVRAYFIIGWPNETPEMFNEAKDILLSGELEIDQLRLAFPVPFLGTPLYQKYKDRLLTKDWTKFTGDVPVVRNEYMDADEMKRRVKDMLKGFYTSEAYRNHVKEKVNRFPWLKDSFEYWQEYMKKRGIISNSHSIM